MLEILALLVVGFGMGRSGDILVKERRRKKRLNELMGRNLKSTNPKKKKGSKALVEPTKIDPQPVEENNTSPAETVSKPKLVCKVSLDEIKDTIMEYCNRRRDANAIGRFTRDLRIEKASVRTALEELAKEGRIMCESGFYMSTENKEVLHTTGNTREDARVSEPVPCTDENTLVKH